MQVLLSDVFDPVNEEYRQLSSIFSRLLSWWPWKQQKCSLKAQIEHDGYPPCIQINLKCDDHPSMRPEVDIALKISTCNPDTDCIGFIVTVPGKEFIGQ